MSNDGVPRCITGVLCDPECRAKCEAWPAIERLRASFEAPGDTPVRHHPWPEVGGIVWRETPAPCVICGQPAHYYDEDFRATVCSERCALSMWIKPALIALALNDVVSPDDAGA